MTFADALRDAAARNIYRWNYACSADLAVIRFAGWLDRVRGRS